MTQNSRRRNQAKPDRRVWVFSELTGDLSPRTIARILAGAALQAADDAKRLDGQPSEGDDR